MYGLIMTMRNWLFDHGYLKQYKASIPVISVGNLAVGGCGKTPLVELIISYLLEENHHPVMVSRGYGRKTHGAVVAESTSTAAQIGDEPLQIYKKYGEKVPVVVCESRYKALSYVPDSNCNVVVLDDAYQHRHIMRDCNILVTDWHRLYSRDNVLPFGRLREPREGARRADVIVVTKCPPRMTEEEAEEIRQELNLQPNQHIFFATVEYDPLPASLTNEGACVLVTGIAHPQPLVDHLINSGITILKHYKHSDHHVYSKKELQEMSEEQEIIVTTEKDYARIPEGEMKDRLVALPIRHGILFGQSENFKHTILQYAFQD